MSRIADLARNADDIKSEKVEVPEWGCTIEVRGMDGTRRSSFLTKLAAGKSEREDYSWVDLEPELLVVSCFDPDDQSMCFTEDDVAMLMSKSGAVLGRLSDAAMRVSGLGRTNEDNLGKDSLDSGATQNDASTSS